MTKPAWMQISAIATWGGAIAALSLNASYRVWVPLLTAATVLSAGVLLRPHRDEEQLARVIVSALAEVSQPERRRHLRPVRQERP